MFHKKMLVYTCMCTLLLYNIETNYICPLQYCKHICVLFLFGTIYYRKHIYQCYLWGVYGIYPTISVRFASAIDTIIKGKRGNQFLYFYTYAFRGVNRIAWALSSETNVGCFVL